MIDANEFELSNKNILNDIIQTAPEVSISGFEAWNKNYVGDPFKFIVSKHSIGNNFFPCK